MGFKKYGGSTQSVVKKEVSFKLVTLSRISVVLRLLQEGNKAVIAREQSFRVPSAVLTEMQKDPEFYDPHFSFDMDRDNDAIELNVNVLPIFAMVFLKMFSDLNIMLDVPQIKSSKESTGGALDVFASAAAICKGYLQIIISNRSLVFATRHGPGLTFPMVEGVFFAGVRLGVFAVDFDLLNEHQLALCEPKTEAEKDVDAIRAVAKFESQRANERTFQFM
jgi:hypothetical protein